MQSLASGFISLCFLHLSTHERRVTQLHILYRLCEDLMDPIMSVWNPRPLLLLLNPVPVWSLQRHSVGRAEMKDTGGQQGPAGICQS